ncbi:hypothetical protein JHK82_012784 [Glycine max]|nr:hypothetical protein JHK86_012800 [Glycine max]KAG5154815.1 hypothetical protein JHK82_012784 [Glycine max]
MLSFLSQSFQTLLFVISSELNQDKVMHQTNMMKQPEDNFTIEENYNENKDKNDVGDNTDAEKANDDDDDVVDDHQEEAKYLPEDDGPTATEEQHYKGPVTKDADEKNKPPTRHFIHGYHLIQGQMNQHRNLDGYDLGLYAIFEVHAVKKACKAMDDEILESIADSRGGSTAVAAILINGVKLLVVNVGDSRAISCKNGRAKPHTVDHEPEKEKDLIESRGGFVSKKPVRECSQSGWPISNGMSIWRWKTEGAHYGRTIRKIDEDTEFIILASDGLWKVRGYCMYLMITDEDTLAEVEH